MTSTQGDFAQALAGQAQQQTVSIANQITTAALKHVEKAGTQIDASIRSSVNFIEGSNVTLTVADNSGSDRVDVTVAASNSGHELDYAQITSDSASITGTTEGTTTSIVTGNAVSYDGTRVRLEFFSPEVTFGAATIDITFVLRRDSTVVGLAGVVGPPQAIGGATLLAAFDTPAAGTHTYKVDAYVSGSNATVKAGPGGSGGLLPAYLRVTKA